jgi:hypothetical protein
MAIQSSGLSSALSFLQFSLRKVNETYHIGPTVVRRKEYSLHARMIVCHSAILFV